jgi:hypothetical protein
MIPIGISLGMKCDSAVWGVSTGIREFKENGYNTCPFDEMLSNYPGIIECLKDDFKHFCDTNYLILIDTSIGEFIYNTKYRFAFNHESPGHADLYIIQNWTEGKNHFINNNFAHFISRYTKRIQNFRNYLKNPNHYISFILQRYNTSQTNIRELREALKIHYPHLRYYIHTICIHNTEAQNILQVLQFNENEEEFIRLKI